MSEVFSAQAVQELIPAQSVEDEAAQFALNYLSYFFHNPESGELTPAMVQQYTKQFQSMVGVAADGQIDGQVVRAMQTMRRCGNKDYSVITTQAAGVPSWKNGVAITYWVEQYVEGLSHTDQDTLMAQAFAAWMAVADLKISRTNSRESANVVISTGRGRTDQFDGSSGTLAWAYLPPQPDFRGQLLMRFDLDETWIMNTSDRGILYLNVATHEFGHLLGLDHSQYPKALMAPYYSVGITKPQPTDDIPRIQSIYGQTVTPLPPPPPPAGPSGKIKVEITVNSLNDIKINGQMPPDFDLT